VILFDLSGQQFGNYRLVRRLGTGGFASVYLGQHSLLTSQQAAIKILHLQGVDAQRFQHEAETTAKLIHSHIVRLLDFNFQDGTPYLVLDYAPQGSLAARHPHGQKVPLATVMAHLKQIVQALQYAHDQHVIHRDLKPDNILIGRQGELLLSDFGIATLTQTGRTSMGSAYGIAGTAYYMAPEQFRGKPEKASDQYALAVIIYEWLCGEYPFSEGDFVQLGYQHNFEPVPLLRQHVPDLPLYVEEAIFKALSKQPQDRFASVQAFARALEQVDSSQVAQTVLSQKNIPTVLVKHDHLDGSLSDRQMIMPSREVSRGSWSRQQQEHDVDPDIGIDEDAELNTLEQRSYDCVPLERAVVTSKNVNQSQSDQRLTLRLPETPLEHDEDHIYDDNEALPPGLCIVKKPKSSRRKFLIGAGIVAASGAGVGFALSQPTSKSPIQNALQNTDAQLKQAFDQGMAQGADNARKALLSELDNIHSFTLQGAIDAARLTRVAYDVFVSPIIQFGSTLSSDFLNSMLRSFRVARQWLAGINQDNVTLAAIQKVLESWVTQVQNLPKQLDAITQTDLDGAQAYLHALKQKIEDEKKALDYPTPTAQPESSSTPKK
jgi:serine/threonine protein kinase